MAEILGFKFKWSRIRNRFLAIFDKSRYAGTDFFGLTRIQNASDIKNNLLTVGNETYGKIDIFDGAGTNKIIIGNYCSIANGTKFILAFHRADFVTTYPFKFLKEYHNNIEIKENDHISKGDIKLGNDVWIGVNSIIMSGVTIGDGAIIGSNSVVTKDVEPYSIVAGNPAKHIKYRVEDPVLREKLQQIAWWNWDKEKIHTNINKIMNADIQAFVDEFSVK